MKKIKVLLLMFLFCCLLESVSADVNRKSKTKNSRRAGRDSKSRRRTSLGREGRDNKTSVNANSVSETKEEKEAEDDLFTKIKKRKENERKAEQEEKDNFITCEKQYYECMDSKLNETLQSNEMLFTDYNDMLSDVYSGMKAPVFKCLYSPKVKELHSKYYYGASSLSMSGYVQEVNSDSIEYYSFLKENAISVAQKKLSPVKLNKDVIKMANLKMSPKGLKETSDTKPVSYKVARMEPEKLFEKASEFCSSPKQNKNFAKCNSKKIENTISDWKENWFNEDVVNKSCKDYEAFLLDKLAKAEKDAKSFISGLSNKLFSIVEQHNLKEEADEELENINRKGKVGRFGDNINSVKTGIGIAGGVISN